ncbi:MAG: topoisomerase DNA-binding C4 zinc finger domain-containing protein [Oscillospiraceae bacterium]
MEEKRGTAGRENPLREFCGTSTGDFESHLRQAEQDLTRIKVPDEVSEEICPECGRNLVVKSGRFGRFLACPGYPECSFTMPLVVAMPGRCPKCGGRIMKRTGNSKKTGKQYTYYCCEHVNSRDEANKCDFMTWDVPVKDDCPVCGHTMFKKAGKGFKKPFCINPVCPNFLPEDKRGYPKKPAAQAPAETAETNQTAEGPTSRLKKLPSRKPPRKSLRPRKMRRKRHLNLRPKPPRRPRPRPQRKRRPPSRRRNPQRRIKPSLRVRDRAARNMASSSVLCWLLRASW